MIFGKFANKLFSFNVSNFVLPSRTKIYHYALKPILLNPDDKVSDETIHLFKPVQPIEKWKHSGSNYDSVVDKFIGILNKEGNKETARNVMRLTFREIKLIQLQNVDNNQQLPVEINLIKTVNEAVKNCSPLLVLHSVSRGGALYKVPAPPKNKAVAIHIAIKLLIDSAKDKPVNQRIWVTLGREIVNASENQGRSIKKKIDHHKQCEENRAYASYRTF